eukprot:CAMPEP_0117612232 /NCGR_PEP_ID=MMETSP0784-20121206/82841_1 /TAXON_ID=39447 /ORGANISM="" /LENGTH=75 /DNA_ID=CAMNT_0005415777 /DNA_START=134 /DNA_END=358 /DNA_ORIENTATION=-
MNFATSSIKCGSNPPYALGRGCDALLATPSNVQYGGLPKSGIEIFKDHSLQQFFVPYVSMAWACSLNNSEATRPR